MISRDEEQRMLYRARQKQLMDERWRQESAVEAVKEAFATGVHEGEAKGEAKGRTEGEIRLIQTLQSLLQVPQTPVDELRQRTLEDLQSITTELQELLRKR